MAGCVTNEDLQGDNRSIAPSVRQFTYTREDDGTVRSEGFWYDIYIYYDLEDHDFVKEHIINYLDRDFDGNHKSCLEIKDFLPGRNMADCILEAMRKSIWTLIVFSKNSIKNGHTFYLYKQCVHYSGLKRVVPVIIDDVEIPEALFDLNVPLDFTALPPDEFHTRISQTLIQKSNLKEGDRKIKRKLKTEPSNDSDNFPQSPSDIYGHATNPGINRPNVKSTRDEYEEPDFVKRQLDPNTKKAILVRNPGLSPGKDDDKPKWSVDQFHDNPEDYIMKFSRTNRSSAVFRRIERTLLRDVLPEVPGTGELKYVHKTSLVLLACCPSSLVKKRAMEILEQSLVRDDLQSPTTADGLMATEERLRASLLDEPFKSETVGFQTLRLIVYGKLLFYMAMHVEKKHLSIDGTRLNFMSDVIEIVNQRLKQIKHLTYQMTYALHLVSHAHSYLVKLLQDFNSRVAMDKISDQIDQLGNVRDFYYFTPWHMLETMLKRNTYWIYMDIILSFVGNLVFTDKRYLRVLLQHLSLLLRQFPMVKVQYKAGVLLCVSRILAKLTVYHKIKEIRISAVIGFKSPKPTPGLKDIWTSDFCQNDPEFSTALSEIIRPLLLNASDIQVRNLVYNQFYISNYGPNTEDSYTCIPQEEEHILSVVAKHLTEQYQCGGELLSFDTRPKVIHHSKTAHIIEGYLNYATRVALKLPRNFNQSGNQCHLDMLKTELNILRELNHDNILKLLSFSYEDFVPLHFVVDYMDGGNLLDRLHYGRNRSFFRITNNLQLDMCIQVAKALVCLKAAGVVHRDICAYNVLLGSTVQGRENQWHLKLSGFGLARKVRSRDRKEYAEDTSKSDFILTRWSDPESLSNGVWSLQTDVWMFVCLMFEIFTLGAHPFPECQEASDAVLMFERGHRLMQQHCVPSDIHLLIQDGMHRNPLNRITISQCLDRLEELRHYWAAERVGENYGVTYPDRPRREMERITPDCFQEKYLASSQPSNVGRQRSQTSLSTMAVAYRVLDSPDEIDASNADQPIPIFKIQGAQVRCLINQEPLKEDNWNIIKSLKKLDSKNITIVFGLDRSNPVVHEAFLESETLSGGNILEAILHDPSKVKVMHVVDCMVQIVEGLQHLHNKAHLVHTDLKAQYILVDKDRSGEGFFQVKISRLARCRLLFRGAVDNEGRVINSTPVPDDSLRWAAAEVILAPAFFSRASDIYSLALVFWQLLYALQVTDNPDFRCLVPHPQWPLVRDVFRHNLLLDKHPEQPANCPDWAYMLIKVCLRDRFKRPSLDYIRETLTTKKPFKSELLASVKRQLDETPFNDNINFDQTQPEEARYLDAHPNTLPTRTQWYEQRFDEKPDFYLKGATFGYPNDDKDTYVRKRLSSAPPKEEKYTKIPPVLTPSSLTYSALAGRGFDASARLEDDNESEEGLYYEIHEDIEEDEEDHPHYENTFMSQTDYENWDGMADSFTGISDEHYYENSESYFQLGLTTGRKDSLVELLKNKSQYINLSKDADYDEVPLYECSPIASNGTAPGRTSSHGNDTEITYLNVHSGLSRNNFQSLSHDQSTDTTSEQKPSPGTDSSAACCATECYYTCVEFSQKRKGHRRTHSATVPSPTKYDTLVNVNEQRKRHKRGFSDGDANITKSTGFFREASTQINPHQNDSLASCKAKVNAWLLEAADVSAFRNTGTSEGVPRNDDNTMETDDEAGDLDSDAGSIVYNDVLTDGKVQSMSVSYVEEKFVHLHVNADDDYRLLTRNIMEAKKKKNQVFSC